MLYKSFQGIQLSALGFGAMRLPTIGDGRDAPIDEQKRPGSLHTRTKMGSIILTLLTCTTMVNQNASWVGR